MLGESRQKEKKAAEDNMVRWHYYEFEQTPGDSGGHPTRAWWDAVHGVTKSKTHHSD